MPPHCRYEADKQALELLGIMEGEMEICAVLVDCEDEEVKFLDSIFERDEGSLNRMRST